MAKFEEIKVKIVITGGGSGGHIFPLISVIDEAKKMAGQKLLSLDVLYIGPKGFGENGFKKLGIKTSYISTGKIRRYFSFLNFTDIFKVGIGFFQSLIKLWQFMPDVIFSKGGFGSVPVVLVAKLFRIPLVVHESDSIFGLSNKIGAKFASRVAVSFNRAFESSLKSKTALTGNPIRSEMFFAKSPEQTRAKYGYNTKDPLILILGGSQGSKRINDLIMNSLEDVIRNRIQIFHQTGDQNYNEVVAESRIILRSIPEDYRNFYQAKGFLEVSEYADLMMASDLIVARAGSGTIFEISFFKKPSVLIPLPGSANNHQKINALEYQKIGATTVIEEGNILPHLFVGEMLDILKDENLKQSMINQAAAFSQPDASKKIAKEIFKLIGIKLEEPNLPKDEEEKQSL